MKNEMLMLKPIHKEMIWGGQKLKQNFNRNDLENIGETWVVCALEGDDLEMINPELAGLTLSQVYASYPELFGHFKSSEFPLLVKFIDAKQDLSIQVHPEDDYARLYEKSNGKTECWLVLDADDDSEIIIGHNFTNKEQLKNSIEENSIIQYLNRFKIKKGDFFYIPAGTIHAICGGTMIYEIQQSSKLTYRVFDYNRKDSNGNLRELHLQKALDVIKIPDSFNRNHKVEKLDDHVSILIESPYFRVASLTIDGSYSYKMQGPFNILGCIEGLGYVNGVRFKTGEHAILPNGYNNLKLEGQMKLIISTPKLFDDL